MEMLQSPEFQNFQRTWLRKEVPEACKNCLQVNRMKPEAEGATRVRA